MLGIKSVTHTYKAVFYFPFESSPQEEDTAYKFLEVLPVCSEVLPSASEWALCGNPLPEARSWLQGRDRKCWKN